MRERNVSEIRPNPGRRARRDVYYRSMHRRESPPRRVCANRCLRPMMTKTAGPCNGKSRDRARASRVRAGSLERTQRFERHRAQQLDLARVGCGAKRERSHGAQDELGVACAEEIESGERALDVSEQAFVLR